MGRNIGPKNKIARRFRTNLGLKTNATKVARRLNQAPGVHGPNQRRVSLSAFGKQLLEKQKAKFLYGIREGQFRKYVEKASAMTGDSGVNLQELLEMRMDNVVYRLGFATTRAQARQFVSHGMFTLNSKKMDIPSHIVRVGDIIALKENKVKKQIFENLSDRLQSQELQSWLSVDAAAKTGKILTKPADKDFEKVFDVKLITEYYSTR
ncbi:MAG: 30S ribosomal protein S4 [Candidatus Magasanikbacteria bacterium CG_4_10_14_0_2_um_filter_33_14]|uniref:Small ribosomal subunit protein uS4 n=1 Tax=Candidatus Magasanikbacteria bacterium CG_4_10_14_0_2_um_filter_33_14 TaxID=1974636 RepID=A0A2M7VBR1_9BACT|nr:MAG: 30S ribosomal protein S4 [Candidatus Magasanikbacteria bacterium CG_4_10_14_0_2_um_filter_33_14]